MAMYTIQGRVISKSNGQPIPFATVRVFGVTQTGTSFSVNLLGTTPATVMTDMSGNFNATFNNPAPTSIIFTVVQNIDGADFIIYNETPALNTRWNIGNVVYNILKAEAEGIPVYPPPCPQPAGNYCIFTRIGNITVQSVSQANGYAYPYPPVMPPVPPIKPTDSNMPFGGTLLIGAWFGKALLSSSHLCYYKLQYAQGIHSPGDAVPWHDISSPLANHRYDVATHHWVTEPMGPIQEGGYTNLYRLPWNTDTIPWNFPDLIAKWDTTKITDGVYTIRILGYHKDPALHEITPLPVDPAYGSLRLMLDNTPPRCLIKTIKHNGVAINACGIVPFNGTLSVEYEASDTHGHLRAYYLDALYGHNNAVTPRPALPNKAYDNYGLHPPAGWNGSTALVTEYESTPPASDTVGYNATEMPSCAYQFHLRVDKRTTDGLGLVYWGYADNYHITIQR
jgi:hypothetical protein